MGLRDDANQLGEVLVATSRAFLEDVAVDAALIRARDIVGAIGGRQREGYRGLELGVTTQRLHELKSIDPRKT